MGFIHAPSTGGLALTFPGLSQLGKGACVEMGGLILTFPELLHFQRSEFGAQRGSADSCAMGYCGIHFPGGLWP